MNISEIKVALKQIVKSVDNKVEFINELREFISKELSDMKQPVDLVKWVPLETVSPNDYNPNSVARVEMSLLYKSIKHDGYTQPIVVIKDSDKYVIVDGFHRYFVCKTQKDIQEANKGMLPVVVIEKDINERMASTIRHNRARGEHTVTGMGNMVFKLLENGWTDEEICNHLGMDSNEILKLKHITGFSKLFQDVEYNKAWETNKMIRLRKNFENEKETSDRETAG
jgi:ParB-like chromosome segregation protein Spo0J